MGKKRLDVLLFERALFDSQKMAQAAVMEGRVRADGRIVTKAGERLEESADLEVADAPGKYVSRGGVKLEHALKAFGVIVQGRSAFDAGASTGGFTDCLLQNGAAHVVAADVGYGQLAWRLRRDPRVEVWERTNLRAPPPDLLHRWHNGIDIMTLDLSFISLCLIFPPLLPLLRAGSDIIALVKPQFEAPRKLVGRKGVVEDPLAQVNAIRKIINLAMPLGLSTLNAVESPLRGPEGNLEFFLHLRNAPQNNGGRLDIETLVQSAHRSV
ncbi:MAG: TlyA family RNA methyltransferase, partial [bacterium]